MNLRTSPTNTHRFAGKGNNPYLQARTNHNTRTALRGKESDMNLTLHDVQKALNCRVLAGADRLAQEAHSACGSDMMSDVLAFSKDHAVLLTGLVNPQVVRTAEMLDIICIVFVRGKQPSPEILSMAEENGLVIMSTGHRMFSACGLLYEAGLRGGKS